MDRKVIFSFEAEYNVTSDRITEIYASKKVSEEWNKILESEAWKKIHAVPSELEQYRDKFVSNAVEQLKTQVIAYSLQRVIDSEGKSLEEAISDELKEYGKSLNELNEMEIEESNKLLKQMALSLREAKKIGNYLN